MKYWANALTTSIVTDRAIALAGIVLVASASLWIGFVEVLAGTPIVPRTMFVGGCVLLCGVVVRASVIEGRRYLRKHRMLRDCPVMVRPKINDDCIEFRVVNRSQSDEFKASVDWIPFVVDSRLCLRWKDHPTEYRTIFGTGQESLAPFRYVVTPTGKGLPPELKVTVPTVSDDAPKFVLRIGDHRRFDVGTRDERSEASMRIRISVVGRHTKAVELAMELRFVWFPRHAFEHELKVAVAPPCAAMAVRRKMRSRMDANFQA
jgi:hypothetical protein